MHRYIPILVALLFTLSCRKGELNTNKAPETQISVSAINLSGDDRLNSEVRLSWFGTDLDGFVEGFEISLDQQNWDYTTTQDSTFIFPLGVGQDTADIDFYVRAIDNEGLVDPSPAYLKVPLKNTPPEATFDNDRGPNDTAFCVSTFYWTASDPDGNETLEKVFIKFNEGTWTEIGKNQSLISFLVDTSVTTGSATAQIFYGRKSTPESFTIDGLAVNADNYLYVKSVDIAGAESEIDTADVFYLKNKTPGVNTLWINGHVASVAQEYRSLLNNAGVTYDFLDYGSNFGTNQPVYWDPTFKITLSLFDKLFINAPSSKFPNTVTGENTTLLNYIGRSVEEFHTNGGKSFTTCALVANAADDLENVTGPFAVENTINSNGFTRVHNDSLVFSVNSNPIYPDIQPANIQTGIVPIIASADAEAFYRAQFSKHQGWDGDNLVATIRTDAADNIIQAFFAIELHSYAADASKVELIIGEIMNNEF